MLDASKQLAGEDQSYEIIEDAAVLCLRMFLDKDIVMLKDLSQLRQTFGTVTSTIANKICEVNIVNLFTFLLKKKFKRNKLYLFILSYYMQILYSTVKHIIICYPVYTTPYSPNSKNVIYYIMCHILYNFF